MFQQPTQQPTRGDYAAQKAQKPPQTYGQWRQAQGGLGRQPSYGGWGPRPQAQPQQQPQAPEAPQQPAYSRVGGGLDRSQYGGFAPPPTQGAPQGTAAGAPAPQQGAPSGTAAGAPQGAPATPWYTQNDIGTFQNWAQGRYGRQASQQELQQIGANSTNMESAQAYADTVARQRGWQGPAQPAPSAPTQPGPGTDPTQPGNVGHQGRVAVDPGPVEGPGNEDQRAALGALMQRILENPESLNETVQTQMRTRDRERAVSQAEQLRGAGAQANASRGFSAGGGRQAATDRAVNENLLGSLINANRDTAIQAATTNNQDRLNAAAAGDAYLSGETGRWQATDNANFRNNEFRYGQMRDDRGANLQEYLGREGVGLDNRRLNEDTRRFDRTMGFDVLRFLEDTRRNNRDFSEGSRQHNNQIGLGYGNLNLQGQQGLLNYLLNATGGQ